MSETSDNDPGRSDPAEQPEDDLKRAGNPPADDSIVEPLPETDEAALRAELEETKNRLLRSQAELENYRKRVARQTEERRYANLPLLRDLLPVWDNMGRAVEAAEKANEADSLLEGFKMVGRQLEDVLARCQCTRIEALGEPFDPHLHEAILQQPSAEHSPGTVILVTEVGFQLHDRVVRPSKVIVSAAVPQEHSGETNEESREKGSQTAPPEAGWDRAVEERREESQDG